MTIFILIKLWKWYKINYTGQFLPKSMFLTCFVLIAQISVAQYHTDIHTGSLVETLYEVEQDPCSDSTVLAGIRNYVDGNPNLDQIMFSKADFNGNISNPVKVYPPDHWNVFKAHPNVELLAIREPQSGVCNGYVMAISYSIDGVNFNLHILRLDNNLNKICEVTPLSDRTHSEYINGIVQDEDGTIVFVGSRETTTSKELLLIRMDQYCNILNIKNHTLATDPDNYETEGLAINHFVDPWGDLTLNYTIVGHIGQYSFMSLIDYDLNVKRPEVWDIDNDNRNKEKAIDIIQHGNDVFIVGQGATDNDFGNYTYFSRANFVDFKVSFQAHLKKYYFIDDTNYPTDMELAFDQDHMIIGGVREHPAESFPFVQEPYLIEVDLMGNITRASIHKGHYYTGRTLDVTKNSVSQYLIAGDLNAAPDIANRTMFMAKPDVQLQTTGDCYSNIESRIVRPEVAFLQTENDEIELDMDDELSEFPIVDLYIQQGFCEPPLMVDCDSVTIVPGISYAHVGLNYTFTSTTTTSSGVVSGTNWTIRDPYSTVVHVDNANPTSFLFPSYDNYSIELAVGVTLLDGSICMDTTTIILCTDDVTDRTFDVNHDIAYEHLEITQGDWAVTGLQNVNKRYATMGHYVDVPNQTEHMYFARYDKKGASFVNPVRETVLKDDKSQFKIVEMKERLDKSGKLKGYLTLINRIDIEKNTANMELIWLTPGGQIICVEEFCAEGQNSYMGVDMIVHGDTAVITGNVFVQKSTPFVMIYNHASKMEICTRHIDIGEGRAEAHVVQQVSENSYAVAGTYGLEAFCLQIDNTCKVSDFAYTKDVDNNSISKDIPVQIVLAKDEILVLGTTCESKAHDLFVWNPGTQQSVIYKLNDKGSKLTDATYLPNGHLLLAGSTNLLPNGNWDKANPSKGFLMEVDYEKIYWANIYDSDAYEVTHIAQIDLEEDNGIFATGWSMPLNSVAGVPNSLTYSGDSWIVKTDPTGRLFECDCYDPIDVKLEEIPKFGKKPITIPKEIDCLGRPQQFLSAGIKSREFVCDRYCPDDCCYEYCIDTIIIANPNISPGYYHAGSYLSATGNVVLGIDSIDMRSGKEILLDKGFEVELGDAMKAQIEECKDCCEMDNPLEVLEWIKNYPEVEKYSIKRMILDTECIYVFKSCEEFAVYYYDCDGNLICSHNLIDGIDCPTWSPISVEVLQECR